MQSRQMQNARQENSPQSYNDIELRIRADAGTRASEYQRNPQSSEGSGSQKTEIPRKKSRHKKARKSNTQRMQEIMNSIRGGDSDDVNEASRT